MRHLNFYKMHMHHMLRKTGLSNQVKIKTHAPMNKKSSL